MFIGARRIRDTAGVVVREDDSGGIVLKCATDDFTRIDAGLGERTRNSSSLAISRLRASNQEPVKDLELPVGQAQLQVTPDIIDRRQGDALSHFCAQCTPGQFQHGNQLGAFGRAQAQCFLERIRRRESRP